MLGDWQRGRGAGHLFEWVACRRPAASVVKNERGQFALELALLAPLLLVLAFLTFEFGRVFGSWLIMTNAAREGARVGINQTWCATGSNQGSCSTVDNAIIQRVATTAQFLTVQTTSQSNECTVNSSTGTAPATASLAGGQTSCVAVYRYVDGTTGDHILQVWAIYQIQTLLPVTGAIPFLGTLRYPATLSVTGLSSVRSLQ